jgi:hypothetical protein
LFYQLAENVHLARINPISSTCDCIWASGIGVDLFGKGNAEEFFFWVFIV